MQCAKDKMHKTTSWWKYVTQQLYTVEKKDEKHKIFSQVVSREMIQFIIL